MRKSEIQQQYGEVKTVWIPNQLNIESLARLNHELSTSLTLVLAPLEELMCCETNADVFGKLLAVKQHTKRLLNLANQLRDFMVSPKEIEVESRDTKFLKKVLFYIERHLTDPALSVENLSKHVGMSRGTLYYKLLEITGQSPIDYIRSIKLDRGAVLLEKSDMNIAQVAYAVGFTTPNYFAKSFKMRFGVLPSEFLDRKRKVSVC
ncbi:helix-turn-helix domain-containing protein [Olivibacter sitiensis]|uniref:helix-turn-helix domain-containing protein n=1 Tax=Olivibacter sitiensis TaxID=376470 RepID=UPI0003F5F084|nr:AraC family transcriptional regulator [Olivibacter sitiensis]